MPTKIRAEAVSMSSLSSAISNAMKIAAQRHKVALSETNLDTGPQPVGRIARSPDVVRRVSTIWP